MKTFSIITPTYNRAYILGNAITSLIEQTFSDWEMIIVDDGSTDNTKAVVNGFNEPRIKYFYQINKGPSAARNTGFAYADGQWIVYLDSDNDLLPNYLEHMFANVKDKSDILYALPKGNRYLELYKDGTCIKRINDSKDFPTSLNVKDVFMRKIHIDCNGFMHSRIFIDKGFKWDENIHRMEDWDFFMQLAEAYPDNFLYIQEVLSNYYQRFGTDGIVGNSSYASWAEAFETLYQKHRHDKLLQGQSWYPAKVEQYNKMQEEYEEGKIVSPTLRYFV